MLADFDAQPSMIRAVRCARTLEQLDDAQAFLRPRTVAVVRTFAVEPGDPFLTIEGARRGLRIRTRASSYSPVPGPELAELVAGADAAFVAVRVEDAAPAFTDALAHDPARAAAMTEDVVGLVLALAGSVAPVPAFVHDVAVPATTPAAEAAVRDLNATLAAAVAATDGVHLVGVRRALERAGADAFSRRAGGAQTPYSPTGLHAVAAAQARAVRALDGPVAKALIVDCDGVLWGGVVGEDGIEGIALGDSDEGRRHVALQHELKALRDRGTLLAVCSRNEEADVLAVLRSHPASVLHEDDFVARRIDWSDKAESVAAIADQLGFAPDHVAFLDDDAFQRDRVRSALPGVHVIAWPDDVDAAGSLDDLELFDVLTVTDEDRSRTAMYRAAGERAAAARTTSPEEHLRTLGLVATVSAATSAHVSRLAQLTQRTNQFTLTTRRYTEPEMAELVGRDDVDVVRLDLRDRFGDYGTVGCGIVRRHGARATIDSLLLSCRVLGRDVERVLVRALAQAARSHGAQTLVGEHVPSARNAQVADLYPRLGFARDGDRWAWDLTRGDPAAATAITVVDEDETP
ncbi:MAG TPA: HAD-IIIC family phosphatase [Mycobacteriales bacterium]|nr:HAD-IIIC family phosphatase [Mycobacteriales bacterium]